MGVVKSISCIARDCRRLIDVIYSVVEVNEAFLVISFDRVDFVVTLNGVANDPPIVFVNVIGPPTAFQGAVNTNMHTSTKKQ